MYKTKLSQLKHQTHGKLEKFDKRGILEEGAASEFGLDFPSKYARAADYEDYLKTLNTFDLQALSVELGIIPVDNREILIKKILQKHWK